MATDDRKIKTKPAPKNDALPKNKSTPDSAPSKAEGGEKDVDLSSGYSRGEGQKPVSKAYTENWNLIFCEEKEAITPIEQCPVSPIDPGRAARATNNATRAQASVPTRQ
jgi:hypothetical protein